ncbi:MAG: SRPBCC domain-containing protein [Nevskia sp.]|nr:SRPBCC domain-containing protein [Nevskia sp.]
MSYEINHKIGVKASPEDAYQALTQPSRLAQWWTSDTRGDSRVGGTLEFWFGNFCQKFEVLELKPGELVRWKAAREGMEEWPGTEVSFALSSDAKQTSIRFRHSGWSENTPFHAHCSMKWATFMLSLKDLLEKGEGRPAPRDLAIDYF